MGQETNVPSVNRARGEERGFSGRAERSRARVPLQSSCQECGRSPPSGDYTSSIGRLQDGRGVALGSLVRRAAGQTQLWGPCSAWSLLLLLGPEGHL